jgi:hypothetical protein|nr:MAG TPA: hypothetical protein [Caudoviricetes sp.]
MSTSISYEDISELAEELKEHQIVVGYTISVLLRKTKILLLQKIFRTFSVMSKTVTVI